MCPSLTDTTFALIWALNWLSLLAIELTLDPNKPTAGIVKTTKAGALLILISCAFIPSLFFLEWIKNSFRNASYGQVALFSIGWLAVAAALVLLARRAQPSISDWVQNLSQTHPRIPVIYMRKLVLLIVLVSLTFFSRCKFL